MPHPLAPFKYCPVCGSSHFTENDARSKRCAHCGFTFYHNAAAATVAVIINERGELLCTVRQREPARGTLDLPGGFVDPGESIEAGCLREVMEETGGEAEIVRYLFSEHNTYPFSGYNVSTADAFFLVRLLTPAAALRPMDDAARLEWHPLKALDTSKIGLDSVRRGVERVKAMMK